MCFIVATITAVGRPGAKLGPWGTNYTLSSAPSAERGDKRHIRDCLRCGLVVARLRLLLFLPGWSGRLLRRRIQGNHWLRSLALREGVASCRAWTPSILPILRRSGLRIGWCWLSCLLSRHKFRATESSRKAGACWEEVSHHLRWLLCLHEAFRKALHRN